MTPSDETHDIAPTTASRCPTCNATLDPSGICPNCATSVRATSATLPESDVPHELPDLPGYRVLSCLGEGGMGAVFLAEDLTLGRRVAIKMVSARVAHDAQLHSRFAREARTLATIEHPHVVRIYTFGESAGSPYLVMEYVEGETLAQRLTRDGHFEVPEALRITRQVAKALAAAWQRRVIHRDIKPSNVLLDRENEVRVVDFGLAKPMHVEGSVGDASLTQSGYMLGTPHYISPEQAQGHDVDFRSDVYSLGIMLYHMIAGERPFDGTTPVAIIAKHLQQTLPLLENRIPGATPAVDRLIAWMTAKDPAARPQSYEELIGAIDGLRSPTPATPLPTYSTVAVKTPAPVRVSTIAAISLLLVALVAGALAWFYLRQTPSAPQAGAAAPAPASDGRFVVAVTPFYGPDADSEKEGRVMAALIERSVMQRLGADKARVLGIDKTGQAVRDHDSARALGEKLGAHAVIWGEAFALRQETEIEPHVTMMRPKERANDTRRANETLGRASERDASMEDRGGAAVKLAAEAPNQIEMRKMSATGVGDLVVFVAGIYTLEQRDAAGALEYFRQSPPSPESMRFQADALLQLERLDDARSILEKAIAADPKHAASRALLGDLQVDAREYAAAAQSYTAADAIGEPYSTTRGFVSDGHLYIGETYRSKRFGYEEGTTTLYLLGIDPASGRVVQRQMLPGIPMKYERSGDATTIRVNAGRDEDPLPVSLRVTGGKLERVAWAPPHLTWRVRTTKAGRAIAGNFLEHGLDGIREFGKPLDARLAVVKTDKFDPDLPSTLPDLERALREEAERDPTQPWTPFLLALTLREEKRLAESDTVFAQLLAREWPVAYWEFSWMASYCERLRLPAWSSRLAARALERRKATIPYVPEYSSLIERVINANFVRHAAMNFEGLEGYRALQQARELTGFTPEGDELASIAWARWFEARGRHDDAERERRYARRVRRSPMNIFGTAQKVDMSIAFALGAALAFLFVVTATILLAVSRARRDPGMPGGFDFAAFVERHLGRRLRVAAAALVVALALILLAYAFIEGAWPYALPAMLVGWAVAEGWMNRRGFITTHSILQGIDGRERIAVAIAFAAVMLSLFALVANASRLAGLLAAPIGTSDALGSPRTISVMQDHLKKFPDNRPLQYVVAVLAHYGGETETAAELYRRVGGPKASQNLTALEAHRPPAAPLTDADWASALTGSWRDRLQYRLQFEEGNPVPIAVASPLAVAGVLLTVAILLGRGTRRPPAAGPDSKLMRALMLVVPGMWDARRGSMLRALLIVFGIGACIMPLRFVLRPEVFNFGPVGFHWLSGILWAFPLPDAQHGLRPLMMIDAALADPLVAAFLAVIALLGLTSVVLHLSRFPRILRKPEPAPADRPTLVTPAID